MKRLLWWWIGLSALACGSLDPLTAPTPLPLFGPTATHTPSAGDEFTRECVALLAAISIRAVDVITLLRRVFRQRGAPEFLRSDNGSEFAAQEVQSWLEAHHAGPAFIEAGHPCRTDSLRRTMINSVMNAWAVNGLTHWPKPASSSKNGGGITIPVGRTAR